MNFGWSNRIHILKNPGCSDLSQPRHQKLLAAILLGRNGATEGLVNAVILQLVDHVFQILSAWG